MRLAKFTMSDSNGKSDTLPLTWLGRVPVYATTILVAVLVAGMVATVMLASANANLSTFAFNAQAFWKKAYLWQLFSHPLLSLPSFFYLFGLLCAYWFGVGIETYLGRRIFLRLVFLLCLVPALTATAWWLAGTQVEVGGNLHLAVGLFIAYATLYPNAEWWNWITMKWLAFAGIVLQSLMYFPKHQWELLTVFLSACAAAHLYTRYEQGHWALPKLRWPRRKPALRILPRESARSQSAEFDDRPEDELDSEVDALLEKIARNGLASLSANERARLEQARETLLKKERK
jgi:hypothetical protein